MGGHSSVVWRWTETWVTGEVSSVSSAHKGVCCKDKIIRSRPRHPQCLFPVPIMSPSHHLTVTGSASPTTNCTLLTSPSLCSTHLSLNIGPPCPGLSPLESHWHLTPFVSGLCSLKPQTLTPNRKPAVFLDLFPSSAAITQCAPLCPEFLSSLLTPHTCSPTFLVWVTLASHLGSHLPPGVSASFPIYSAQGPRMGLEMHT